MAEELQQAGQEIARLKDAEESLRASEGKYRSLFETMGEGFCIIEKTSAEGEPPDFTCVEANPAFRQQVGGIDPTGKSVRATLGAPAVVEICDRVLRTGDSAQFECTSPFGRALEFQAFRTGEDSRRVAVLFQDVTSRKDAERRQALRLKVSDALRSLNDPARIQDVSMCLLGEHLGVVRAQYFEVDPTGQYAEALGGYARGVPPALGRVRLADFGQHIAKTYAAGGRIVFDDLEADARIDASERSAYEALGLRAFVGVPLVKYGRFVAGVGVSHDHVHHWTEEEISLVEETAERCWLASERARAEADLRESEARLHAALAAVKDADRRKDEYLAMLGHELRNPLGAIRTSAELLTRIQSEDERVRRATNVLHRQSTHISRIIDGLLDVSRIARGKIVLVQQPLELRRVLESALEMRSHQFSARGLHIETILRREPLWVMGDEARLVQVFDNLLGNAIKFTPSPGTVTVRLRRNGAEAVVRVRDTGVGIREELLGPIFEPFQQDLQDMARGSGGLGLGLALARGLVTLHHGTIEAHSAGPGRGAEFVVRLPLTSARPASHVEEPLGVTDALRVLVVEDNVDAASVLRELLELDGHEVHVAATGQDALGLLEAHEVDVVLCDLGLPGMSGLELAKRIRKVKERPQPRLIAVTGYGQPKDRDLAAAAGFDEHLTKPVDYETLTAALRGSHGGG